MPGTGACRMFESHRCLPNGAAALACASAKGKPTPESWRLHPRAPVGIDEQPDTRGGEREHAAGNEGAAPQSRARQNRDDGLANDATDIASGIENTGSRAAVGARNVHGCSPVRTLVDLDGTERRGEHEHRRVGTLDVDRYEEKHGHERQRNERYDAKA